LEDIDCMTDISHKRKEQDDKVNEKDEDKKEKMFGVTLSGLLNELDGISNASGRLLVMTTNHVEKLDPALIRPGRIDFRIELKKCSTEMIRGMYTLIFDGEMEQEYIPCLKAGVLTPAEVMNIFMSLPKDTAMKRLIDLLDTRISE